MKIYLFLILFCAAVFSAEQAQAGKRYVLVGVAGFQTKRNSQDKENIYSDTLCRNCEESGVWTNLNKKTEQIAARVFLSHASNIKEVEKTLALFSVHGTSRCNKDLGLIIMGNSWGASLANELSNRYFAKCGERTDLFVLIDGIQKPLIFPFAQTVTAKECWNFYQTRDTLHGGPLANCQNEDLSRTRAPERKPHSYHIWVEWTGSEIGAQKIAEFLASED